MKHATHASQSALAGVVVLAAVNPPFFEVWKTLGNEGGKGPGLWLGMIIVWLVFLLVQITGILGGMLHILKPQAAKVAEDQPHNKH